MNFYKELKGYVEGKVPYFSCRKNLAMKCVIICVKISLRTVCKYGRFEVDRAKGTQGKRSTFNWFEYELIITKVKLISILPLFPQSKIIGQINPFLLWGFFGASSTKFIITQLILAQFLWFQVCRMTLDAL